MPSSRSGWEAIVEGDTYELASEPTFTKGGKTFKIVKDSTGREISKDIVTVLPKATFEPILHNEKPLSKLIDAMQDEFTLQLYCYNTKESITIAATKLTEMPEENNSTATVQVEGGEFSEG